MAMDNRSSKSVRIITASRNLKIPFVKDIVYQYGTGTYSHIVSSMYSNISRVILTVPENLPPFSLFITHYSLSAFRLHSKRKFFLCYTQKLPPMNLSVPFCRTITDNHDCILSALIHFYGTMNKAFEYLQWTCV